MLKTKYDYLDYDNKNILTHDSKTPSVVIYRGFNDEVFKMLGEKGYLKGKALIDYEKSVRK